MRTDNEYMVYCKGDDCKGKKKHTIYNFAGMKPEYCNNCKKPDMIDVKNPKCIKCNLKIPNFNLPTESKALYCNNCKKPDMIDVKNQRCIKCNLKKPNFNLPTETKGLYCNNCKLPDMINVVSPRCIECNLKQPAFNFPTEKKGLYCFDCKKPDMIDVKSKRCIKCNLKIPCYNLPTESKGLYCFDCKKPDMINVKDPKCIKCNNKIPAFNLPTESKGLYCFDCKKPNMINVVSPRCIKCNLKRPNFNLPTESKALYCFDCKKPDMINVKDPKCIKCNNKIPAFNLPTESKALYCFDCKLPDMIDVKHPKCLTNLCEQRSQKDNYCMRCYYFNNPTKKPKRLKVKEEEVLNYLKEHFKDINLITDKALIGDGICLKNRPDVLIHLNNHSVIIEIDEEQHKWYEKSCDEARINNIQEALNRPIIIIRFNPDAYIENGKKIKSCFKNDEKTGLKTIPKNQQQNWYNRLLKLKETLASSIENYTDEPIRIIKLFYDNI